MILFVTNTGDVTADLVARRFAAQGIRHTRLDTDRVTATSELLCRERMTTLRLGDDTVSPDEIHGVWLRRPRPLKIDSPADAGVHRFIQREWTEAVECFLALVPEERWINHPARNSLASHKVEQLKRATAFGLRTPRSLVTQRKDLLESFWRECERQVIAKPLASGTIERQSPTEDGTIFTSSVDAEHIAAATERFCPTLFQERVGKRADVRVTVIDTNVVAVSLAASVNGEQILDIRRNNMEGVSYAVVTVPPSVREAVLKLVASYGLRFAAVDFAIEPNGSWVFFEVNPNGQWAWLDLEAGTDITSLLIEALTRRPADHAVA